MPISASRPFGADRFPPTDAADPDGPTDLDFLECLEQPLPRHPGAPATQPIDIAGGADRGMRQLMSHIMSGSGTAGSPTLESRTKLSISPDWRLADDMSEIDRGTWFMVTSDMLAAEISVSPTTQEIDANLRVFDHAVRLSGLPRAEVAITDADLRKAASDRQAVLSRSPPTVDPFR